MRNNLQVNVFLKKSMAAGVAFGHNVSKFFLTLNGKARR
jgi:hypothetical protein